MAPVVTDSPTRNLAWEKLYAEKQQVNQQAAGVGQARQGRYDLLRAISSLPYLKKGMNTGDTEMMNTGMGIAQKSLEELEGGFDLLGSVGNAQLDEEAARGDQFKNLSREGELSYLANRYDQNLLQGVVGASGIKTDGEKTISRQFGGPLNQYLPTQYQPAPVPQGNLNDSMPQYGMTSPKPTGSLYEQPVTVPTQDIQPKQKVAVPPKKKVTVRKKTKLKSSGKPMTSTKTALPKPNVAKTESDTLTPKDMFKGVAEAAYKAYPARTANPSGYDPNDEVGNSNRAKIKVKKKTTQPVTTRTRNDKYSEQW